MRYIGEPYHKEGIKFICENQHCGLFADPGTGKTGMVLAALTALKKAGMANRALIIAPRLVIHNVWPNEIKKFDQFQHLKHALFHAEGKDINLIHEFVEPKADIVLTNPESLKWMLEALKLKWFTRKRNPLAWPWDVLIIDESSKFKEPGSVRFKTLKPFLPLFNRRCILTGTPAPHSLADIWSQLYIVDQGEALGPNITRFKKDYFEIDNPKFYSYKLRPGSADIIHRKIAHKIIRFDETLFKLPERIINDVKIKLPEKARKIYDDMESQLFAELDSGDVAAPSESSKYQLCRQISNGRMYDPELVQPAGEILDDKGRKVHTIHREKIEAVENILDELQGKPALISYFYRHDLTALKPVLERRFKFKKCPYIGAGASVAEINQHIKNWNAGKLPALVVHPASMAHGLNLQSGGNDLIFYSLTDNLEDYQQLIKRLHRRGVDGQVRIHRILAEKTIDDAVKLRLNQKAENQTTLLEAVKMYRNQQANAVVAPMAKNDPVNIFGPITTQWARNGF